MNYQHFRQALRPFPVFSTREIGKYYPDFDNRRLVEWQEKGYIEKIRNRYYRFTDREVDERFRLYTSNKIYRPSYISLEVVLSRHGFIPEGVFQVTACTTRKTQSFDTPLGRFIYRHLKPDFYFGYHLKKWEDQHLLIADAEKALVDYLYLHPEIGEPVDLESLRWNADAISTRISMDLLNEYESLIGSPALSRRLNALREYLHVEAG